MPASMILTDPILICLGLDIAKAKIDACLLLGSRQHHAPFDNSKPGLKSLRSWCAKLGQTAPLTVLESSGAR